jgi:hypothetical protein
VIRHLLHVIGAPGLSAGVARADAAVVFPFEVGAIGDGRLAG